MTSKNNIYNIYGGWYYLLEEVKADNFNSINNIIGNYNSEKTALISILQDVQSVIGYLPEMVLKHVAESLDLPLKQVYGVATFFKVFRLQPKGQLLQVCLGTACHVRGGPRILEEIERVLNVKTGETTKDGKFSLEKVYCLGCCAIGPIVKIGEEYYGHVSPSKVASILKK